MAQPVTSPGPQDTAGHPAAAADRRWLVLVVVAVAQLMTGSARRSDFSTQSPLRPPRAGPSGQLNQQSRIAADLDRA
jgi:hypothetical protein